MYWHVVEIRTPFVECNDLVTLDIILFVLFCYCVADSPSLLASLFALVLPSSAGE